MEYDREEFLSVLVDARPALNVGGVIPELSHFWFDKKYVYAYNGGLGIRITYKTDLDCGLPGKALMDWLRASSLKTVSIEEAEGEYTLVKGKSRVTTVALDPERRTWSFPTSTPKRSDSTLTLSESVMGALGKILFVKTSHETQVVHHGVTVVPQKGSIELYTTDSRSIARVTVVEKPTPGLPRFVLPWAFVDRVLQLIEPGATLHVLEDCLLVGAKGTLVCSNLLELPDKPDLAELTTDHINGAIKPIPLPVELQQVLTHAGIFADDNEPILTLSPKGSSLQARGKYKMGIIDESLPLKGKVSGESVKFVAPLIGRALAQADSFTLSSKAIVLYGGDEFVYVLAANT